jgi:hypothetical protein
MKRGANFRLFTNKISCFQINEKITEEEYGNPRHFSNLKLRKTAQFSNYDFQIFNSKVIIN